MKKRILLTLLLCSMLTFTQAQGQSSEDPGGKAGGSGTQATHIDEETSQVSVVEGSGKTIRPMGEAVDPTAPPDGVYHASFAPGDMVDGILAFHLYVQDCYDEADIRGLTVGDSIIISGKTIPVESVEQTDSLIAISGGLYKSGGYDLCPFEAEGCWKVVGENDHNTYADQGEAILPFANEIIFRDARWLYQPASEYIGASDVIDAISESPWRFTELNTVVTIEDGVITKIESWYIP